jgi:hypothetical protein
MVIGTADQQKVILLIHLVVGNKRNTGGEPEVVLWAQSEARAVPLLEVDFSTMPDHPCDELGEKIPFFSRLGMNAR